MKALLETNKARLAHVLSIASKAVSCIPYDSNTVKLPVTITISFNGRLVAFNQVESINL